MKKSGFFVMCHVFSISLGHSGHSPYKSFYSTSRTTLKDHRKTEFAQHKEANNLGRDRLRWQVASLASHATFRKEGLHGEQNVVVSLKLFARRMRPLNRNDIRC